MGSSTGFGSYRVVQLASGSRSIHDALSGETFHPVIGPVAEAEALYVRQLRLLDRFRSAGRRLTLWDIGLGGAANPITVMEALKREGGVLRIVSFDRTTDPLRCALEHAGELGYPVGWESALETLLERHAVAWSAGALQVEWTLEVGDFPSAIASAEAGSWPKPDAVLFDAFSPAKNPDMWTLPLFCRMRELLAGPCAIPTYSRSTLLRVTWLLAGFWVGRGCSTGEKEETTVAANDPVLLERLLDRSWLERCQRSTSAEPLRTGVYRQAPLSPETWEALRRHPQFSV